MGKSSIDINGYRRQEANPISMVGVFPYTGKQIDYDGSLRLDPLKIYWVLRPPEELFHPEAIKSFNGLPIRIGHVMLGSGFKSVDEEPADGCIFNVRQSMDMPEYLIGDFTIYTDKMKEVLQRGRIKELSLGYRCQYIPETGVFNGQPYEFKQANLRGNHLALVENGRCGSSVRVCDEAILTFDSLPEEMIKMNDQEKVNKAKKMAEALKNGDETVCQDCLDFISFAHDDRLEVLAALKDKKAKAEAPKNEPNAQDGKAKDEIPPPPPPEKKEDNSAEAPAATPVAPAAAPAAAAAPASAAEPPTATASAKEGGEPVAKDCGTVTTPSISAPLTAGLEGTKKDDEKKNESKAQDGKEETCKDGMCKKDKAKDGTCDCGGNEPKAEDGKAKDCNIPAASTAAPAVEPSASTPATGGAEEPTAKDGGITKEPLGGVSKPMPEKKETFGESNTAMDDVSPEIYAKVAAECDRARKLAIAVGQMGVTVDSAGKREIEVAREAVKQMPNLQWAADKADAEVLCAIRGAIGARAEELARAKNSVMTLVDAPAVAQDASPKKYSAADIDRAFAEYYGK